MQGIIALIVYALLMVGATKAQENLTLSSKETQKELDKLQDQYAELEESPLRAY